MKALISALALLSFVAASTIPVLPAQAQAQTPASMAPMTTTEKAAVKKKAAAKKSTKKTAAKKTTKKKVASKKKKAATAPKTPS